MNLLRNSLYSLLPAILPTFLSIATLPMFVSAIGAGRYGVLAIAWIVLGYFGAADFGIGRAITQRISVMREASGAARANAVWSALVSMAGFGVIGGVLVYLSADWYFSGLFQSSEGLKGEIRSSLWLVAACNPVMAVSGVLSGALVGAERFKLVSICSLLSNSALLLFPLATALFVNTSLSALILASLAARLLGGILLAGGVWLAFLKGQPLAFSRAEMRRLANFGAWIMVTALIGPLMVFADRLMIGAVQNAAAVAAYAIPFQIASRTLIFPLSVTQALFPRFAYDGADDSRARARDFAIFGGQLFAPLIIALICLASPLLQLWLGGAFDPRSVMVAQIVLAGFWFNAIAQVPYGFIQARGNPRFTAMLHVAELPFYLLLLYILGLQYGLSGIAAAFALRCAADCILLCRKAGAADRDVAARLAGPGLLVMASVGVGVLITDWLSLLLAAGVLVGLALATMMVGIPAPIWKRICQTPLAIRAHKLAGRPLPE